MRVVWWVVLSVFALQAQAAMMETITQTTTGWCSPTVGKADNVIIICQGVDPKALARLNELLDKKDLELQAKIREAEEWTQKYRELEQRLATQGQDEPLVQLTQTLLKEGKLDEAGVILDRLLDAGEKGVEQTAANHFNRAAVYALQFQLDKALPHYQKAYEYRRDNVQYAVYYTLTLQQQHRYDTAYMVYKDVLLRYRQMAQTDPQAYLPSFALMLNNLGNLYSAISQFSEAEQVYQEALAIRRELAQATPQVYLPDVAGTLNNLGNLYRFMQQFSKAEQVYQEALAIWRELAQATPQVYLPDVARTLSNLGSLYNAIQRFSEAEQTYHDALTIWRELAQAIPQAYSPNVARTLKYLGLTVLKNNDLDLLYVST
jgi:tetratricopeptide (TPR) repeat protein